MYSTNLTVSEHDNISLFDGLHCVGIAYGWEHIDKDEEGKVTDVGPPTQTAKDNALLWSLAPEMVELLREYAFSGHFDGLTFPDKVYALLDKLAHAIPPASVAADG